jgi:hypothetical protein
MALGARRADIIGHVIARGGRFALLGIGIGVALAAALAYMLRTLLVGVSPFDPITHASVAGLLVASASWRRSCRHGGRRSATHCARCVQSRPTTNTSGAQRAWRARLLRHFTCVIAPVVSSLPALKFLPQTVMPLTAPASPG